MTPIDLVTGGCGFIGRHLVDELLRTGRSVRVLDCGDPYDLPACIDLRRGSILDDVALTSAMDGVARIYHLAGIAHLWCPDRRAFARVNTLGTERILAQAPRGVRVVHCSTETLLAAMQGGSPARGDARPGAERMPGPYTRSKALAERAALAAAQAGQDVVIASPAVPIGPGDRNMTPPSAMLSLFLGGTAPAFLDCTLNLVDVRDAAEGIRLAGERGHAGQRYLLGGETLRLRQLLVRLTQLTGRPMPRVALPGGIALAAATISEWLADHLTGRPPVATREGVRLALRSAPVDDGRSRRDLGYRPRPIDEALALAVAWLAGTAEQDALRHPTPPRPAASPGRRGAAASGEAGLSGATADQR
ncbi:MAG: NAD-dependent epimerase/dehydratase family protein [Methylobacterium sp.]|uniref:NAD-dependent epimerase/dehydratase family protein n=1 Tax=Methylobacterium sp. TaxID=409 RepID=UPI00258DADAE|nr:NAD-dependent epimerase/dehydratase family protein [Methylobacterium sp.]MBY0298801.1 NAD-dependent epimerase/dehydratase family protein [Methylobacterium sp.]